MSYFSVKTATGMFMLPNEWRSLQQCGLDLSAIEDALRKDDGRCYEAATILNPTGRPLPDFADAVHVGHYQKGGYPGVVVIWREGNTPAEYTPGRKEPNHVR